VDERRAQPLFQPRHGLGDGRFGQAQLGRGAGEGTGLGDLREDRPGVEIGQPHPSSIDKVLEPVACLQFYFLRGSVNYLELRSRPHAGTGDFR